MDSDFVVRRAGVWTSPLLPYFIGRGEAVKVLLARNECASSQTSFNVRVNDVVAISFFLANTFSLLFE